MVIEVAGTQLDADVLVRCLKHNSPKVIKTKMDAAYGDSLTTNAFAVNSAKHIASAYNRAFANDPDRKVSKVDIDNCSLWETIQEGRTFSALRREAQLGSPSGGGGMTRPTPDQLKCFAINYYGSGEHPMGR